MRRARAVVVGLASLGCAAGEPATPLEPRVLFPADYAQSFVEVRSCRKSSDHELDYVRVLADPAALAPYSSRATAFPEGSVLLKEQYDFADDTCSGDLVEWTLMLKDGQGQAPLGWRWQRVSRERRVVEADGTRCTHCHAACTGSPGVGFDYTCAEP